MAEPTRVCALSELAEGECHLVGAAAAGWTDDIAVFRDGADVYAVDDTCPHEEASLSEGWLEDGAIECPQHQSRFDLRSGKVLSAPATRDVTPHQVDIRDGAVWLTADRRPDGSAA